MIDLSTDEGMRAAFQEIASWEPGGAAERVTDVVALRPTTMSRRTTWLAAAAAVLLVAVVAAIAFVGNRSADDVSAATGTWTRMTPSPLSPRRAPASVWIGDELLVFGGYVDNGTFTSPGLLDGAAYSPSTNRWRSIAPMPPDLTYAASPCCSSPAILTAWTGEEVLVVLPDTADTAGAWDLLSYRPSTDSWTTLERHRYTVLQNDSPVLTPTQLVPIGPPSAPIDTVIAMAPWKGKVALLGLDTQRLVVGVATFDPAAAEWSPMIDLTTDAQMLLMTSRVGNSAVVNGRYLVSLVDGADHAGVTVDLADGSGTVLPLPEDLDGRPRQLAMQIDQGGLAVGTRFESDVTSAVVRVAYRLDPASATWSVAKNPDAVFSMRYDRPAVVAVAGGHVLFGGVPFRDPAQELQGQRALATASDVRGTSWRSLPTAPIDPGRVGSVAVWTGTELIVWGGTGAAGTMFVDGAVYRLDRTG